MYTDIHGKAILDHYLGNKNHPLYLHSSLGHIEELPVDVFINEALEFNALEQTAMENCQGSVLDIGAAAGSHALYLQSVGTDITALDISPGCADVMKRRGVRKIEQEDFWEFQGQFDTLLLLMNGLGFIGRLYKLNPFLSRCKELLRKGGQIILDSADISYAYKSLPNDNERYYGEISYRYEYKGESGESFQWLYLDHKNLMESVEAYGLNVKILIPSTRKELPTS